MISALTVDEIIEVLRKTPEQAVFDWKQDFVHPSDDESRGELIKDISAIANSSELSYGYIFYGVDPRRPDPVVGISKSYDDSRLQQLLQGKLEPLPEFLYYEVSAGPRTIAVIQVAPSRKRPFIIRADIGRVRKGQIVVRRGSATDGATLDDLFKFFYGANSQYFANVRHRLGLDVQHQQALNEYMRQLEAGAQRAEDAIWQQVGLPGKPRR